MNAVFSAYGKGIQSSFLQEMNSKSFFEILFYHFIVLKIVNQHHWIDKQKEWNIHQKKIWSMFPFFVDISLLVNSENF